MGSRNILVSEKRITTPIFRLSFPAVFKPAKVPNKDKLKYGITMLFEKQLWDNELIPLRDFIKELIAKKWGSNPPKPFFNPIHDGDSKTYDGYAGNFFVSAQSDFIRPVVDSGNKAKGIKPHEITDQNEIYAGCYCKAVINTYAWWDVPFSQYKGGISVGYLALQKIKDGEPFTKFEDASEDFEPITTELLEGVKEDLFDSSSPSSVALKIGENLLDQL